MKQAVPKQFKNKVKKPLKKKIVIHHKKKNDYKYGTSKLERDFARDFLDANGINYVYQYEAREIGRWFDFAITADKRVFDKEEKDGLMSVRQDDPRFHCDLIVEVDGSFFHSDPRVVKEDKLTPMQKHNKFVDKLKDHYAGMHCITLVRFWEYDIRNNPQKVLEELKKYISICEKNMKIRENKRKPH